MQFSKCLYIIILYLFISLFSGWEVAGNHIQAGAGSSDNDYLILNLHVPGFK